MSLQWYPGHMTKGRRELAALVPSQDVVIEVRDARLPAASSNPLIAELARDKPRIAVLTKSDLADPDVTDAWLAHFERTGVRAFAATTERPGETRKRIAQLCAGAAAARGPDKRARALVCGVPNVGKSTLINTLAGKQVAKVSDRPAVTREQQAVTLDSGMTITDSPGLMWPKIEDEAGAFRLALAGSIPATAIDYLTIAMFGATYLLARYGDLVRARWKLPATPDPMTAELLLYEIGKRRGGLQRGGKVDLHVAAEHLVHDFRAGVIGRISLEEPPPYEANVDASIEKR